MSTHIRPKPVVPAHNSPADRGSADSYYWRPFDPHKGQGSSREELTDPADIEAYRKAYDNEKDGKDWL